MISKCIYLGLSLFFALFLGLSTSVSAGQKVTHITKKGDTLWSICKQYYGDPYLWPELWEMNKFITNPHWIKPGDVITLLNYEEKKPKPEKKIVLVKKQPLKIQKGIDVSSLANTKALGFLRQESFEPWGRIFEFKTEKVMISENDTAYVKMYKKGIKPGDKFTVYTVSNPISHPLAEKKFAYIHSFKGMLEIKKAMKDYYVAIINESFRAISKNDLLMPLHPVSSCILPIPCQDTFTAYIWASKDNTELLGQYSVVYIDAGRNRGIRKGNILKAIEERESISDEQKKERVSLPPTLLGKILILETTKNNSTGVVFWASKNFTNGAKVRPLTWDKRPIELAPLPACPVE